jgi:hypothetical protein
MATRVFKIRLVAGAVVCAALLVLSIRAFRRPVAPEEFVTVILKGDGRILLEGRIVAFEDLDAKLHAAGVPPRPLTLRTEGKVPYAKASTRLNMMLDEGAFHARPLDLPGPGYREQRDGRQGGP